MDPVLNQQFRRLLAKKRWEEAAASLADVSAAVAADLIAALPDEQQQALFRVLPVRLASVLLSHFPYFHQYILLHTRTPEEMRQILDAMAPDERLRLFDELPEEAWLRLTAEIGEIGASEKAGTATPPERPPVTATGPVAPALSAPVTQVVAEEVPAEPIIQVKGVEKLFVQPDGQQVQVIAPLDLAIYPGQIVALLGASGCGKSTLLRILSGLSKPTAGDVLWHGRPLAEIVPNVAIVFQSFALFPWLTVLENVEAPLLARGASARDRHTAAMRAVNTVGLKGFETAYPKELSGGMRQRVGFARALVVQPEVLFMDEPFSALDVLTAENLRSELLELWHTKKIDTKAVFIVTHNIEEAVLLADRVIVLGRNPARIRSDFHIALPQPRDRKSPQFLVYVDFIYKVMTRPEGDFAPPAVPDSRPKAGYQLLPHARPGGIAGLLEVLLDTGGEEDLYHLAERLLMDVDDLLPIIDASVLLGFATLDQGDVKLTPEGRAFAEADIATRKVLFRQAALAHIRLFQQIDCILETKSDHSISLELFRDVLDEHYPDNEVERQLETALYWGRYCEMFSYDSESEKLLLVDDRSAPPAAPSIEAS
ncbi:MAG TPA: AAA-associated domain-containing protein [Verrucomicrobiae bacterium]|jgi:NitT/TauT family transport system ATP-binding protein|nr:AAA-associated domain-containing protein [Verrucomicrobiae bacterium]